MEFTAHDLRQLRYRMNWTQAEMARILGCELEALAAKEHGKQACEFTSHEKAQLLIFRAQADSNSAQTHRRAVADGLMVTRGLAQILDGDVIECLVSGELSKLTFR